MPEKRLERTRRAYDREPDQRAPTVVVMQPQPPHRHVFNYWNPFSGVAVCFCGEQCRGES